MLDGTKVKAACEQQGITQEQLALLLQITKPTVSKILRNKYPGLKLQLAERVAITVRKDLCTLLTKPPFEHGAGDAPPKE